jgi:hypothetical protein
VENNIWQARAAAGAVMLVGFALFFYLLGQHRFAGNIVRKGGYIFAALCAVAFAGGQISGYYWQGIPKVTYQIYLVALCGAVLLAAYVLLAFLSAFIHYRKARRMVVRAAAAELKISPAPAASEPPSSSSEQR